MSIIYSFLQKRKMHESQHGYIMIFIAYALSALLMIMGSDLFYNIKSSAAGISEDTQEETQNSSISELNQGNINVLPEKLTDTSFVNPYGLTNTAFVDTDTIVSDNATADTSAEKAVITSLSTSDSELTGTDTVWLLGNAMDEDTFDKVMKMMGTLDSVKEAEKKLKEKEEKTKSSDAVRTVSGTKYKNLSENEVSMLERIVQAEAGGEDMVGKVLIANVIMNRVKSGKFPDSIKGVIFQQKDGRYQFSPVGSRRYWSVRISNETEEAVKKALNGVDYSEGALYFVARKRTTASKMVWFDTKLDWLFKHGGHEFYKNK